jgi:hypothetical protein
MNSHLRGATVFVGPNSFGHALSVERADEIGFPDLDAVVAEDRVCRRRVEEEIGQRELQQVVDAGEFFGSPRIGRTISRPSESSIWAGPSVRR